MTPQRKRANQRATADALFSKLVRSRGCCEGEAYRFTCSGNLQTAHVFSRRYLPVRFEPINAFALCAAHHVYWTHHPLEWEDWCREALGSEVYDELRRKAKAGGAVDYKSLIPDLRRRLNEMEAA